MQAFGIVDTANLIRQKIAGRIEILFHGFTQGVRRTDDIVGINQQIALATH
jgi:hypothetical protein